MRLPISMASLAPLFVLPIFTSTFFDVLQSSRKFIARSIMKNWKLKDQTSNSAIYDGTLRMIFIMKACLKSILYECPKKLSEKIAFQWNCNA